MYLMCFNNLRLLVGTTVYRIYFASIKFHELVKIKCELYKFLFPVYIFFEIRKIK